MVIVSDRKLYTALRVLAWVWFVPWLAVGSFAVVACFAGMLDEPLYVYTVPRMFKFAAKVLLVGAPGWAGIILTTRALRREMRKEQLLSARSAATGDTG